MANRKLQLTPQDENDLESITEIYNEDLEEWFKEACKSLTRVKSLTFSYLKHEIFINNHDEFTISVSLKVDTLEDTLYIPFYVIDDFNYEDVAAVDHRVLRLDAEAGLDKLAYPIWSNEKRILRLAYWIWVEVRSWL